jgi:hypothetical protein
MNPTLAHPLGLFWTTPIPMGSVQVRLHTGDAVMHVANAHVFDYGNILNSLTTGAGAVPGTASFRVVWSGVGDPLTVHNTDDGHSGQYIIGSAQMEWTATAGPYRFRSDPLDTSTSEFAIFGQERNGIFFT